MKIGNLIIDNPVFLAPMAGVTDLPYRILVKQQGCGLLYTEMISAKGLYYNNEKTSNLTEIHPKEKPVALQIFGSEPEVMGKIAEQLNAMDFEILDINMGCPTPKITKNGDGSALMKNPKRAGEIIKAVSKASKKPVTVKIRRGWDDTSINAVEMAKIAEESGAKAIAIHGRTREQFYSGQADWSIIKEVKDKVSIPVIGNGDITSPELAKAMIDQTGCDAIMIGRAAQGNPWIFRRTVHYLKTGELLPEPTPGEIVDMILKHMELTIQYKGERVGIREMRKHISWYTKGLEGSNKIRKTVNRLETQAEIKELLKELTS
ncbi:tRNA dihydrouridine synthase DusB [Irregularibacter muris]|uniref:tRNA-dihydrouridine synthase n=1 Tax=Irregularibacter muris TaxID=1796619 RepID=A0AAE3HEH3_9FIRM|nr:tRNA dihydrouridine synthase DusB [Irregularibacter muris]MCR1899061.1 tRNA dihydrouridine synthase DusB [Irregularibacter muris]